MQSFGIPACCRRPKPPEERRAAASRGPRNGYRPFVAFNSVRLSIKIASISRMTATLQTTGMGRNDQETSPSAASNTGANRLCRLHM